MSRPEIVNRAGGENGPVITSSKAETIVALGGQVTVCAVDPEGKNIWGMRARVTGGNAWKPAEPRVGWTSLAENTPDEARTHAACVEQAARIADESRTDPFAASFRQAPPFVHNELSGLDWKEEDARILAAQRYHAGDADWAEAWYWAVSEIKRVTKGDDHDASH